MSVTSQADKARQSALKLQGYSTDDKNKVLSAIAEGISAYKDFIIAENKKDLDIFPDKTSALFDRLLLNEKRVMQMVEGVRAVIDLKDPVGEVTAGCGQWSEKPNIPYPARTAASTYSSSFPYA